MLSKLPLGSAVDLQYPVGGAISLKDDIHGAANTVFDEQLWCSKPLFILKGTSKNSCFSRPVRI